MNDVTEIYVPLRNHLKKILSNINAEKRLLTNSEMKFEIKQKISLLTIKRMLRLKKTRKYLI